MPASFAKIDALTLRGRIAEEIKVAILNGSLREGERLVERKLAAQFNTSLTAVREALIELEGQGFLSKKPNSGTHVTKLSLEELEKLFSVRRVLEGYAVEEAARLVSGEDAHSIDRRYTELLDAARSHEAQVFVGRDFALHKALWNCAHNEYLESVLHRVVVPIFGFSAIRLASCTSFDLLQDAESHLPIIEAVKQHDVNSARQALLAALDDWLSKARDFVPQRPGTS